MIDVALLSIIPVALFILIAFLAGRINISVGQKMFSDKKKKDSYDIKLDNHSEKHMKYDLVKKEDKLENYSDEKENVYDEVTYNHYGEKKYKSRDPNCEPITYKFPRPEPECLDQKQKCGTVCDVECKGPSLNKHCKPSCEIRLKIMKILLNIDCINEKIVERISLGQACESSIKCLLKKLEEERRKFVDLLCEHVGPEGRSTLMCLFNEHDLYIRHLIRTYVQEVTACYKTEKQKEQMTEKFKSLKLQYHTELKLLRSRIAESIHKILPTLSTDSNYFSDYLIDKMNLLLAISKQTLIQNKDDSDICECLKKNERLRDILEERLSLAISCTGCR